MIIKKVSLVGLIETNAYFYIDEKTKHGFLIDPAAEAEKLLHIIQTNNWIIEKMLITHGHFDHIGAVQKLAQILDIPYLAHQRSQEYLSNGDMNLSNYFKAPIILREAQYVKEGDIIALTVNPQVQLQVIYTPGHTQDAVTYYDAKQHAAFVGDTIFKNSIGATHFPGGNLSELMQSIKQKILTLPDDTILYSGHSEPTTVFAEKNNFSI